MDQDFEFDFSHLRTSHLWINDQIQAELGKCRLPLTPNERRVLDALNFLHITLHDSVESYRLLPAVVTDEVRDQILNLNAFPVAQLTELTRMRAQTIHAALRSMTSTDSDGTRDPTRDRHFVARVPHVTDAAGSALWYLTAGDVESGAAARQAYKDVVNVVLERTYQALRYVEVRVLDDVQVGRSTIKAGLHSLWDLLDLLAAAGEERRNAIQLDRVRALEPTLERFGPVADAPKSEDCVVDDQHELCHLRRVHLWINDQARLQLERRAVHVTANERRVLDALHFLHGELANEKLRSRFFRPLANAQAKAAIVEADAFPASQVKELTGMHAQTIYAVLESLQNSGLVESRVVGGKKGRRWRLDNAALQHTEPGMGEAVRRAFNEAVHTALHRTYQELSGVSVVLETPLRAHRLRSGTQSVLEVLSDLALEGEANREDVWRAAIRSID